MTYHSRNKPVSLEHHWMPFTANRDFKASPRMISGASGLYYRTPEGEQILDMTAGLWCSSLGHGRPEIAAAVAEQFSQYDFAPSFNFGHTISFELTDRLQEITPEGIDRFLFTGSGSESVDTALKIAYAYHHARGQSGRKRLIGRMRAYHGMGFGGLSVGGLTPNRTAFGSWLPADHLRDTHDLSRNAFTRGLPEHGVEFADELEVLLKFHDPSTVAAVIVEPIAGAGGVLLPPKGYLKRLREICDAYDVLLIFDEVITGFGRTGSAFAAQEFSVTPDIMTMAKGITAATVPMGAVGCTKAIYDAVVDASPGGVELFHGYTYSAHPIGCAAALACLDIYEAEGLYTRAAGPIGKALEEALHSMADLPGVIDIRNYGLVGAIEFKPREKPGAFGTALMKQCWAEGLMVRQIGDAVAVSPPLVVEDKHIAEFQGKFRRAAEKALG